jgi:hypothetical protein
MSKSYLIIFFSLLIGACGREKSKNETSQSENNSSQDSSFWVPLSENDSVKYIRSTSRKFNQGRDSVMFIHYVTNLYKVAEDASNPKFKKQSLELLNIVAQAVNLPDTLYLQAMGVKSDGIIKKSTDFNVLAARNGDEWIINDDGTWKSLTDF